MLGGSHHVCMTKNAIEIRVISVTSTAKTFPISPRVDGLPLLRNLSRPAPSQHRLRRRTSQYGKALNVKFAVLVSVAPMVTSCVCVPYCSCHAVTVYLPAGSPFKLKEPSGPVTA